MRAHPRASAALALLAIAAMTAVAVPASAQPAAAAPTPTNVVRDGHARFQVITPTLIRLEYADDDQFTDAATFNAQLRTPPPVAYTSRVEGDSLVISTASLTLRYQRGSGPFSAANTSVDLSVAGRPVTAHPQFPAGRTCPFGTPCEAEEAGLTGGAGTATDHSGYSGAGFVAGYERPGATASWTLAGVPADGDYTVAVRYANDRGSDGQVTTRTLSLTAGGVTTQLRLAPTGSWDNWADATATVHLPAGTSTLALACGDTDSCRVNVDRIAVVAPGDPIPVPPPAQPSTNLGGYYRALDGQSGPVPLHDGLLDTRGWYLLDDTDTALWTPGGFPQPRPAHQSVYEDGYFFGYGHDYRTGLRDLAALTGPAPLLPQWAFGNWFSRYQPYTTADYEQTILPTFRAEQVPLDVLVIDTDFKNPSTWNGWNWNPSLFPDPQSFMDWTKQQGLHVTLNVHSSIESTDPQFATANATAGGLIPTGGTNYVWDWSDPKHVDSYFSLHQPFEQQGVRFWWLDWCCDDSRSSMPGLTPDSWINQLYTSDLTDKGLRGFAFARLGSSLQNYGGTFSSGAWAEHRSTVHFTGDTQATWSMLNFESYFTAREGNIGVPYVTHDIGSFLGGQLPDDLYLRWVQLGAFQPIDRLHSNHAPRLPWEYDDTARGIAENFMRLRESLVPYLYTTARQSYDTGLPMVRGLYLDYPEAPEAYQFDHEYMLGDQMLVAPVATPGTVASTQVWFPPGTWVDYFTGAQFTGPATRTITTPLSRMPVYVKAGSVLPTQPYTDNQHPGLPTLLRVDGNAAGSTRYYEDAGDGLGYQHGGYAWTTVAHTVDAGGQSITVDGAQGDYQTQPGARRLQVDLTGVTQPTGVTLDGSALAPGLWQYDAQTRTVHAKLPATGTRDTVTVRFAGVQAVPVTPPPAVGLELSAPALVAGDSGTVTATVNDAGPGPLSAATLSLPVPTGWTATPTTPTTVDEIPAGGTGTVSWRVTAPAPAELIQATRLTTHLTYSYGSPPVTAAQDGFATSYVSTPVAAPYRTFHSSPTGYFGQSGDRLAILADGTDTWQGDDAYGAVYLPGALGSSGTATVRLDHQDATDQWAKAGLMMRSDMTGAGRAGGYAMVALTPGNGVAFQWDSDGNGSLDQNINTGAGTATGPIFLRLQRDGGTVTAAYSTDGTTWTVVGTATVPGVTSTEDTGVFATAHAGVPGLATFTGLAVS
ncbi:MAG: carbohydrate-binding protein [Micromonosporaceae bacterium]|nr:carbohydrate-binding protein [Micromonosporaceae bacterium]